MGEVYWSRDARLGPDVAISARAPRARGAHARRAESPQHLRDLRLRTRPPRRPADRHWDLARGLSSTVSLLIGKRKRVAKTCTERVAPGIWWSDRGTPGLPRCAQRARPYRGRRG